MAEIQDGTVFPATTSDPFPPKFDKFCFPHPSSVAEIFRRLSRVYAHILYAHFSELSPEEIQASVLLTHRN